MIDSEDNKYKVPLAITHNRFNKLIWHLPFFLFCLYTLSFWWLAVYWCCSAILPVFHLEASGEIVCSWNSACIITLIHLQKTTPKEHKDDYEDVNPSVCVTVHFASELHTQLLITSYAKYCRGQPMVCPGSLEV